MSPGAGSWQPSLGAVCRAATTDFRVWAPIRSYVELLLDRHGEQQAIPMEREGEYWIARVEDCPPGTRYRYRLDHGEAFPDPCSRSQPEGVHGASEVVDPSLFIWSDGDFSPPSVSELVIYECHIGTLTPHGTFDAAIGDLFRLRELGITAVEVMPVATFPGTRDWGYNGASLFAPAAVYGGPEGFRRFADAAHAAGLAVILDVVYNHFGPEGNYTGQYSDRYVTAKHQTPWGDAVNFDDAGSAGVREFVIENLLHWVHEYHVDGFRFDATHAITDDRREHILAEARRELDAHARGGRRPYLIAETDENDRRYLRPRTEGGFGFDAVWADDFHNVIHALLHGERDGYYASFRGTMDELARTIEHGFLYEGQVDAVTGRRRGTQARDVPWHDFVYCLQNHDQVGNRAFGERIHQTAGVRDVRALTFLLLLLPQIPLIFQGQEFLATTPFLYFTDMNPELGKLVTEGRRQEFAGFSAFRNPEVRERIPDPQALDTYLRSKLHAADRERAEGQQSLALFSELLQRRISDPGLKAVRADRPPITATHTERALIARFTSAGGSRAIVINIGDEPASLELPAWGTVLLHSNEPRFGGTDDAPEIDGRVLTLPPHCGVLLAFEPA